MSFELKPNYQLCDLLEIMKILRSDNGCPWDKEQTHKSIKNNVLEESYELYEAIETSNTELLKEELGDLLLQIVFHSQIEQEIGGFQFEDVCDGICKKLIERHPHVFSGLNVDTTEEVLSNWDAIKEKSKGQSTYTQTLQSVPYTFPALMKAQKIQQRAAKSGFDYDDVSQALSDLESEVLELKSAINNQDEQNIQEEIGDLLFSCVNVSRMLKLQAEEMLNKSSQKFVKRFEKVENLANTQNINMKNQSIENLDKLWNQAKKFD